MVIPRPDPLREMLSTGEAARLLGVHPTTVRRWGDEKRIKAYRIGPRGERRYRREDLIFRLRQP
jgi:excisionase family DNA binding protein